jgi:hypothetical protein
MDNPATKNRLLIIAQDEFNKDDEEHQAEETADAAHRLGILGFKNNRHNSSSMVSLGQVFRT